MLIKKTKKILFFAIGIFFATCSANAKTMKSVSINTPIYEANGIICLIVNKMYHISGDIRCTAGGGSGYDADFEAVPFTATISKNMRALFYFTNERLKQDYALVTDASTDDDIVYKVTKSIYSNFNKYAETVKIPKDNLFNVGNIPLHPGTLKFLKEIELQVANPKQDVYHYWHRGENLPDYPTYYGLGGEDTFRIISHGNLIRGGKDIDSFIVVKDDKYIHQLGDKPDILLDFVPYDAADPKAAHETIYLEGYQKDFKTVNNIPIESYAEGTIIHLPDRDVYLPFVAVSDFLASKNMSLQHTKK